MMIILLIWPSNTTIGKPDYRMSLFKFLWTTCFGHSYDHHQVRKS